MSLHSHQLSFVPNYSRMPLDGEDLTRELFDRACPDDSFDDLKRRAAFNRQDAGRLTHWIRAAQAIAAERQLR